MMFDYCTTLEHQNNTNDDLLYLNNPCGIFDGPSLDPTVQKAAKKCQKEGNMSELIKLELKTKIQLQKHEKGESFKVEWRMENDSELTMEEKEKRKEQRERNKLAARKHRLKKKQEKNQREILINAETCKNADLQMKIRKLELLKKKMMFSLGLLPKEEAS